MSAAMTMGDPLDALPPKRRAFVLAYIGEAAGNATEAARIAGYAKPTEEGYRLLRNAQVAAIVAVYRAEAKDAAIADAAERQRFYTSVLRAEVTVKYVTKEGFEVDSEPAMRDRLKAAELLGKMQGDGAEHAAKPAAPAVNIMIAGADVLALASERKVGE